ncbi:MAG: hypothetical protein NTZ05_12855, partial [Chloroflexi bacterium]|nr:hypothetical protein [Chloroflexota bacterium]
SGPHPAHSGRLSLTQLWAREDQDEDGLRKREQHWTGEKASHAAQCPSRFRPSIDAQDCKLDQSLQSQRMNSRFGYATRVAKVAQR